MEINALLHELGTIATRFHKRFCRTIVAFTCATKFRRTPLPLRCSGVYLPVISQKCAVHVYSVGPRPQDNLGGLRRRYSHSRVSHNIEDRSVLVQQMQDR